MLPSRRRSGSCTPMNCRKLSRSILPRACRPTSLGWPRKSSRPPPIVDSLRSPMVLRWSFLLALPFAVLSPLRAAEFLDPKVAFQPQATRLDAHTLEVRYTIAKGYYLYKDRFKFAAAGATFGAPVLPAGKV